MLRAEFPEPLPPKRIAQLTGLHHAAVKKWLSRNDGVSVRCTTRGFYRAFADMRLLRRLGLEPFKVHGIQIMLKSPRGGSPPHLWGLGDARRNRDGSVHQELEFRGRPVTVQPDSGLVSVRASTLPFTVPEFVELAAWVEGLAAGGSATVVKIEVNVDHDDWRVRIDGAAVTLQSAREGLWKAYAKQELAAIRFEAVPRRIDMSLPEVARVLQEFSTPPPEWEPRPPSTGQEVA